MFSEFARRLKSFGFVSGRNCRPTTQVQFSDKYSKNHTHMHTCTKYSTVSLRPILTARKPQEECKGLKAPLMSYVFLIAGT